MSSGSARSERATQARSETHGNSVTQGQSANVAFPTDGRRRVVIGEVAPRIEGGAAAAKRVVGDRLTVRAQLFADGHDIVTGVLKTRAPGSSVWRETALEPLANDRFECAIVLDQVGRWELVIEGWIDDLATWHHGLERKHSAGEVTGVDLQIGANLLRALPEQTRSTASLAELLVDGSRPIEHRVTAALALDGVDSHHSGRALSSTSAPFPIVVDPPHARFASWYELFPRSTGADGQHGTFATCESWLPYVRDMGFDVLYLPPIHPIGTSFRKGKNNVVGAGPDEPGSPWAIGSPEGGHTAVHPALGTLADFDRLVARAREHGLRVALDIALQCSPDHPWVKEHPTWFRRRPDGTVQYAENPPKKYQDVVPFDFECDDWRALWSALKDVFVFWIGHGVRDFRVDNPHTKPVPFWKWCIESIKADHPDVLFLSEAFTRPSLKYGLARAGFSQGYTYFTWRSTKAELAAYMVELTGTAVAEYFRPSFWPNTPDILPEDLQFGGRPAFLARLILAGTLSSHYGIYGPAFELMDHVARPGSGEYVDNEKYEIKRWERERPESLRRVIRLLNKIRRDHPALQRNDTYQAHPTDNEMLFCFSKHHEASLILVVVNLDYHHRQSGWVELDLERLGLPGAGSYQMQDLLGGGRYLWSGRRNYVELDPHAMPAQIFAVRRHARTERDFDYFL